MLFILQVSIVSEQINIFKISSNFSIAYPVKKKKKKKKNWPYQVAYEK